MGNENSTGYPSGYQNMLPDNNLEANSDVETKKKFYTYDRIHELVREGYSELESIGFNPDYIVAIGGGGLIPARILRTYLNVPVLVITVKTYEENSHTPNEIPTMIQNFDIDLIKNKNILVVDEVDDTRKTLTYVLHNIYQQLEQDNDVLLESTNLGIFVIHNKKREKEIDFRDETLYIACEETDGDTWIEYPWDHK